MGVADCKIGQLRKAVNSKLIGYMTSIGGPFDHASHAPN